MTFMKNAFHLLGVMRLSASRERGVSALKGFFEAGFNEIIPKPFKTEEFFEKIFKAIQASKNKMRKTIDS